MNRQRKVLITTTYNELGIIIDTKAEEVAQPDLQQTCNQLATDCISRQMAIDALDKHIDTFDAIDTNYLCGLRTAMSILKEMPSAQPETHDKRTETHECDLINRQQAIDAVVSAMIDGADAELVEGVMELLPSAQPEQQWVLFKTRPLTEEEKEDHPEWDCILDCRLPDDGQAILVSINVRGHEKVQYDEFFTDDGSYLDSGYEIGTEAIAWMPLPKPYGGESDE